ncbi:methyltransferase domain-containing protein [Amycolatopsis sp. w19]|uniref:methyltransferase domain-containing protein n=1 Tax=Amycolatopsis sp. w19 TaxID=3448134 RepID=UPI003F1C4238
MNLNSARRSELASQFAVRASAYVNYTTWAHDERLLTEVFRVLPQLREGPLCLDLGGGTGMVAKYGADRYPSEWVVADLSRDMLSLNTIGQSVVADSGALPFKDASFDYVAARSIMGYVDFDLTLAEMGRVMRPDGFSVVAEKVLGDYEGAAASWYERVQRVRNPLKMRVETTAGLQGQMRALGFDVLSCIELRRTYHQPVKEWLSRSGSIPPEAQQKLADLIADPPEAAQAVGFDVQSGQLAMPISWAVISMRPSGFRPQPSLVVSVVPVKWTVDGLCVYVQERRASGVKEPEFFGSVEFPQGHVEGVESIEAAASREVAEEAGLQVRRFIYPSERVRDAIREERGITTESLYPWQVVITRGRLRFLSIVVVAEVDELPKSEGSIDNRGRWYSTEEYAEVAKATFVYPLNRPMLSHVSNILHILEARKSS